MRVLQLLSPICFFAQTRDLTVAPATVGLHSIRLKASQPAPCAKQVRPGDWLKQVFLSALLSWWRHVAAQFVCSGSVFGSSSLRISSPLSGAPSRPQLVDHGARERRVPFRALAPAQRGRAPRAGPEVDKTSSPQRTKASTSKTSLATTPPNSPRPDSSSIGCNIFARPSALRSSCSSRSCTWCKASRASPRWPSTTSSRTICTCTRRSRSCCRCSSRSRGGSSLCTASCRTVCRSLATTASPT